MALADPADVDPQDYVPVPIRDESVRNSRWIQTVLKNLYPLEAQAAKLSPEEKKGFANYLVARMSSKQTDIALRCDGDNCPLKHSCYFYMIGGGDKFPPKGTPCPHELALYSAALIRISDELSISDTDYVDQLIVSELAGLEVYERRMCEILKEPDRAGLVDESATGESDEDGNAITAKHIAYEFQIQERIQSRREKLLHILMATRYEKHRRDVQLKHIDESKDIATAASKSKAQFDQMMKQQRNKRTIIIEEASEEE